MRSEIPFGSFSLANIFSTLWRFLYNFSSHDQGHLLDFGGIHISIFLRSKSSRTSFEPYALSAMRHFIGCLPKSFRATLASWTSPFVIIYSNCIPFSLHKICICVVFPPLLIPILRSLSLHAQVEAVRWTLMYKDTTYNLAIVYSFSGFLSW